MRIVNARTGALLADRAVRAASFGARLRGLIGRAGLEPGEALLIEPCTSIHTFFMRFALDVLFVSHERRVIRAIRELSPWRVTRFHPRAAMVLELPAGTIDRSGTSEGDPLDLAPPA